jgi:hypothetical protein
MKEISLSMKDIAMYTEAFASCAIEGNKLAQEMLELKDKDYNKYLLELLRFKYKEKNGS